MKQKYSRREPGNVAEITSDQIPSARRKRRRIREVTGRDPEQRELPQSGGVTVSTGSLAARRHAGVWAPVIACKTKVATDNLALAA